jgi:hypothetical protein
MLHHCPDPGQPPSRHAPIAVAALDDNPLCAGAEGAGAFLVASGFSGLYWLVPAIGLNDFKSLTDAWVLLVEIKR